jgi:hypothetical protein
MKGKNTITQAVIFNIKVSDVNTILPALPLPEAMQLFIK